MSGKCSAACLGLGALLFPWTPSRPMDVFVRLGKGLKHLLCLVPNQDTRLRPEEGASKQALRILTNASEKGHLLTADSEPEHIKWLAHLRQHVKDHGGGVQKESWQQTLREGIGLGVRAAAKTIPASRQVMDDPSHQTQRAMCRSAIWEFFDQGPNSAKCHTCKMCLKTPTGTTTTLVNHLRCHPGPFKKFEKMRASEGAKKTEAKKSDGGVAAPVPFKPKLKKDSQRAKTLTKKTALFLATGLHSYSIVEEPGFLALMNVAVPEYQVPSRTTFSRGVVPELCAKEKERIKGELCDHFESESPCYALTTDGWTSRTGDSYISMMCHLLDAHFQSRNYNLACRHMPEGHTSENLKSLLLDLATEWGLPQDIPVFIVTDNARNFLSAVSRTTWTSLQCFAHTLQLCIQNAKKETPDFDELCAKARAVVGHYKRSSMARSRLKEIQISMGLEPLEVIQDVATRWNSEYDMMSRLLKLRPAISLDLSERDTFDNLTSSEWRLMASVTSVLKYVEEATRESCSEKHPTLSQVVPLVHCMLVLLTQQSHSGGEESVFAGNLLRNVKSRFVDIKFQSGGAHALSTLLDPRFKAVCYTVPSEKQWAKNHLCEAVEKTLPPEENSEQTQGTTAPPASASSDVWDVFGALASTSTSSICSRRPSEEVEEYLYSPVRPRSENPYLWWRNLGKDKYPLLAKVAQLYLSIPATQDWDDIEPDEQDTCDVPKLWGDLASKRMEIPSPGPRRAPTFGRQTSLYDETSLRESPQGAVGRTGDEGIQRISPVSARSRSSSTSSASSSVSAARAFPLAKKGFGHF
ncbi:hypothetical protein HPB47_023163 [Ixodes persulcatus]|uniref:Uncharacterized protein n=1 Tax=Ixodes persulcatus TaxID=34615 RepID=A0AC60QA11_IXOPE|nr:hypothetical protein HPB47_023163 [Ixodes persulcatus]